MSERAPGAKLLVKCPETGDLSEVDSSSIVEVKWCGSSSWASPTCPRRRREATRNGALLNRQDQRRVELSGPGIGPPQGGPHRAYRVVLPTREAMKLVRAIPSGASRLDFSAALGWKLHELGIISTVYTNVLFETLTAMNVESHTDGISIMARSAPKKDHKSMGEWVTVYKHNSVWLECQSEVLRKDLTDVPMDAGLDATIEALDEAWLKRQPYRW